MLTVLLSIDTGLSRVDPSTFSDQTRMEILVDGLEDQSKKLLQDSNGEYYDISQWPGVTLDSSGNVISILWRAEGLLSGSVALDMLPPHLNEFTITIPLFGHRTGGFYGTIDTTALPRTLHRFDVSVQKMHGSFLLPAAPEALTYLSVRENTLSGVLVFAGMPQGLKHLDLSLNAFTGTLDTADLASTLEHFNVAGNRFEGGIDLTELPARLELFSASKNNFGGTIDLSRLPAGLMNCYLTGNAFHGSVSFSSLPESMIRLTISKEGLEGIDTATLPACVTLIKR